MSRRPCDCIVKLDKLLVEKNTRLVTTIPLRRGARAHGHPAQRTDSGGSGQAQGGRGHSDVLSFLRPEVRESVVTADHRIAVPCQRSLGHSGAHACNYETALYRSVSWRTREVLGKGTTEWWKWRHPMPPEPEPHCHAPPPEGLTERRMS
jgi:hypothetical protein